MVTHTTVGFKGTVRQDGEARRLSRLSHPFTVASAADWAVTATPADRTVSIAAGSGQACGVLDTTSGAETLQLPGNSSGQTRYDLIINRFKWTDPTPTDPVFSYVTGIPGAGGPNLGALVRTPGTQYEGVLAVARVASGQGALSGNDIFNLGVWLSGGVLHVPQPEYLSVLDIAGDGGQLWVASDGSYYTRLGGAWVPRRNVIIPLGAWPAGPDGLTVSGAGNILSEARIVAPGIGPYVADARLSVGMLFGSSSTGWVDVQLFKDGQVIESRRVQAVPGQFVNAPQIATDVEMPAGGQMTLQGKVDIPAGLTVTVYQDVRHSALRIKALPV